MTFSARETSQHGGQPIEAFKFQHRSTFWRFTSADQPLALSIGTFQPVPISAGPRSTSEEDGSGTIEVTVMRDNPIAVMLIGHRPVEPILLTFYRAHRADADVMTAWQGEVTSARHDGPNSILTCTPIMYRVRNNVPSLTYQSQCNHALYSDGCTVDKSAYVVAASIATVTDDVITASAAASKPDGWFSNGYVERDNGDRRFVIAHVGTSLTLHWPFPDLAFGETVDLYPGCDRTEAICTAKFNNLVNHLGFARIPTKNPFDGSLT